jgi:acyl-CoA synthetase (AMP-forming)/AMP-acid ligase II
LTGSKAKLAFGWRSLDQATGRVRAGLFDSVNLKKSPTAVGVIMRGTWDYLEKLLATTSPRIVIYGVSARRPRRNRSAFVTST